MTIKSESRNFIKILLLISLICITAYLAFKYDLFVLFILTFVFIVRILFETIFFKTETLTLGEKFLTLEESTPISRKRTTKEIKLADINYAFYEHKIYDTNEFFRAWNWEILFPSGQSELIVVLKNQIKISLKFNCYDLNEINSLIKKLPNNIPNQL